MSADVTGIPTQIYTQYIETVVLWLITQTQYGGQLMTKTQYS